MAWYLSISLCFTCYELPISYRTPEVHIKPGTGFWEPQILPIAVWIFDARANSGTHATYCFRKFKLWSRFGTLAQHGHSWLVILFSPGLTNHASTTLTIWRTGHHRTSENCTEIFFPQQKSLIRYSRASFVRPSRNWPLGGLWLHPAPIFSSLAVPGHVVLHYGQNNQQSWTFHRRDRPTY